MSSPFCCEFYPFSWSNLKKGLIIIIKMGSISPNNFFRVAFTFLPYCEVLNWHYFKCILPLFFPPFFPRFFPFLRLRDVFDPLDRDVFKDKYVYKNIVVPLDKVVHRDVQATKIVQPCKKTKFLLNWLLNGNNFLIFFNFTSFYLFNHLV